MAVVPLPHSGFLSCSHLKNQQILTRVSPFSSVKIHVKLHLKFLCIQSFVCRTASVTHVLQIDQIARRGGSTTRKAVRKMLSALLSKI
jgi:hypothetical protein